MAFAVECSNDPHTQEAADHKHFNTKSEADDYVEKCRSRFRAIWVSEEGCRADNGKKGWFYFWWNKAVEIDAEWGQPEGRRRGYPEDLKYIVDYIPDNEA